MDQKILHVISVGRLVWEKGYERLIKIHARLIREGCMHTLTIIGTGILKDKLEGVIIEEGVTETCKLLGALENPYPYMAQSDIFVCSSVSEGLSGVVAESMYLSKPIVATRCMGPIELLEDGKYGLLVENTEEGLYAGIKEILQNEELRKLYTKRLSEIEDFPFDDQLVKVEIEKLFVPRRKDEPIKLLFIMMNMLLGGAEKVLAHLLEMMDYTKYEIELVVLANSKHQSIYLDERAKVRFIYESEEAFWSSYQLGNMDLRLEGSYDYAIGFLGIVGPLIFNAYKNVMPISEAVKVNWVHGDFATATCGYEKSYVQELYTNIDHIVCVSHSMRKNVVDYLGEDYISKLSVILNPYNYTYVRYRSRESLDISLNGLYDVERRFNQEWTEAVNKVVDIFKNYPTIIFLVFDLISITEDALLSELLKKLKELNHKVTIKAVIHQPDGSQNPYCSGYLYDNLQKLWMDIGAGVNINLGVEENGCIVAYGGFITVWLSGVIKEKVHKVAWVQGDYRSSHKGYSNDVVGRCYAMMEQVICNTEEEKKEYIKELGRVYEAKMEVL